MARMGVTCGRHSRRAEPYYRSGGTSFNFFGERERSIARSASAIAANLVAAWSFKVTPLIMSDHCQS
jgi:hypothetical protein